MSRTIENISLRIYSNFMKFTIQNGFYNFFLTLVDNMTIIYLIDFMFVDKMLGSTFTPLYFLSPTLYLDMINQKLPNTCTKIFSEQQTTPLDGNIPINNNTEFTQINFFDHNMLDLDNSFCLYNDGLLYFSFTLVIMTILGLGLLSISSPRKMKLTTCKGMFHLILVNTLNLILRPLSIVFFVVFLNYPVSLLYQITLVQKDFITLKIALTAGSVIFFILFTILCILYFKFMNNTYYFMKFPYDYTLVGDSNLLLAIKIVMAMKLNFDKVNGVNKMLYINLIIGTLVIIRLIVSITNRKFVVNNLHLKHLTSMLNLFFSICIPLKLLNTSTEATSNFNQLSVSIQIMLISALLLFAMYKVFRIDFVFYFKDIETFRDEILQFFYFIHNKTANINIGNMIDNIIIGHKLKCTIDDCVICVEEIYNPDLETFLLILFNQFTKYEKNLKEKDPIMTLIIKLLFMNHLDKGRLHRIALIVLKNSKVEYSAYLKIFHLYHTLLDELNVDMRNITHIKYFLINDDLLKCIENFEEVLGFIKSRTENVELVTVKTNIIGLTFKKIIKELYLLKKNKRIYYEPNSLLQMICIVRLLFQKTIDPMLVENLEVHYEDFHEAIDKLFDDNISFLVKYDFSNMTWRIKKVPQNFIRITKFKMGELIDQSLEKILPNSFSKEIIKKLDEEIMISLTDQKLIFKTIICDSQTNVRYVKFDIDVIPNMQKNYTILLNCHFRKKNLFIIDQYGNFINGSDVLYKKIGINPDMIGASNGRINMYTVFNLDRNHKLEDVSIVSLSRTDAVEEAKKMFLLETMLPTTAPKFLEEILNEDYSSNVINSKDKFVVYLKVFQTVIIDDMKYIVYNYEISDTPHRKFSKEENRNHKTVKFDIESLEGDSSSSEDENKKLKSKKKSNDKIISNSSDNNLNTYENLNRYYDYFYETQKSQSMTMNHQNDSNSGNSHSQNHIYDTDIMSYLLIKPVPNKSSRLEKFETFLYGISIFNILLVLFSGVVIIYINTLANSIQNLMTVIDNFDIVYFKSMVITSNILSSVKYNMSSSDTLYDDYIKKEVYGSNTFGPVVNFDSFLKLSLEHENSKILSEVLLFTNGAFKFLGQETYLKEINFKKNFTHIQPDNKLSTKEQDIKTILDIFVLSANEITNSKITKVYLNPDYLNYEIKTQVVAQADKDYFGTLVNTFQLLYNYFCSLKINLDRISNFLFDQQEEEFTNLTSKIRRLLLVVTVFHIIFLVVSLLSVFIYKKILTKKLNILYSVNESHVTKLKTKFQYVKELIKCVVKPSLIYKNIRTLKLEEENENSNDKKHKKQETEKVKQEEYKLTKENSFKKEDKVIREYLEFTGATSMLLRSNTQTARMEVLKKQSKRAKVSMYLIRRLNFQFELVVGFIKFIAIISTGYLIIGIILIVISEDNHHQIQIGLEYSNLFKKRFASVYNYLLSIRTSILINKGNPYINPYYDNRTNYEFFNSYYNVTDTMQKEVAFNPFLNSIKLNSTLMVGDTICSSMKNKNTKPSAEKIYAMCDYIPIMKSNVNTIFDSIMITLTEIDNHYKFLREKGGNVLMPLFEDKFVDVDIMFSLFVEPYHDYVYETIMKPNLKSKIDSYLGFNLTLFVINIIIDFLLILFIWFKIYKQIIISVNNVQLVADSVSNL